jgi:transcriptional regulator with XRE-family HTH domain
MTFREQLIEKRERLGISTDAAAARLGTTEKRWSEWETGITSPPDYAARLILAELDRWAREAPEGRERVELCLRPEIAAQMRATQKAGETLGGALERWWIWHS